MTATAIAAGYRTIGDPSTSTTSSPISTSTTTPSSSALVNSTPISKMQSFARSVGGAAIGAKQAVHDLIDAPTKEVHVDTDALNPSISYTPVDRVQLVMANMRPWSEFADLKAFNFPPASEVKLRLGHNVESFFYNYFVLAVVILLLQAAFHPLRALFLAITIITAVLLYIVFPEDYTITENFQVTKLGKHLFVGTLLLLVLTVGHVFSLLFMIFLTITPIVFVHALLREHAVPTSVTDTS